MSDVRIERDSLGEISVPADRLWGAQTQRSLQYFSIGHDLMPRDMIGAYAILKRAAAVANHKGARLDKKRHDLILRVCVVILAGEHRDMFPLHVWMTGSGTQFNMNLNEVISNRSGQLAGTPLGSKEPVHPNDHVNMSQSSNDTFPSAMNIAAAVAVKQQLIPAVSALRDAIGAKVKAWDGIVKIGRTHLQDATPLTLGQEWSGYQAMLSDNLERLEGALKGVYQLALGGTAVGTGINAAPGFAEAATAEIARLTGLPFVSAANKFAVQGAQPNRKQIAEHVERSLMLVTALVPVIGYDKAAAIAHHAMEHDQTLKEAALELGFVDEKTFDRVVDPKKMVNPYVAAKGG